MPKSKKRKNRKPTGKQQHGPQQIKHSSPKPKPTEMPTKAEEQKVIRIVIGVTVVLIFLMYLLYQANAG